jgi:hypothetical protein
MLKSSPPLVVVFLCATTSLLASPHKPALLYAGFGFVGTHASAKAEYRYSFELSEKAEGTHLDSLLREKLFPGGVMEVDFPGFTLKLQASDGLEQQSLSMAFALDYESIGVEQIGQNFKLVFNLAGQVLIFDFSEGAVVGSVPVVIQLIDVQPREPDHDAIRRVIEALYASSEYGVNLFDDLRVALDSISIQNNHLASIGVRNVTIDPLTSSFIPSSLGQHDFQGLKEFLALSFGKYLAANQKVMLVPFTKGQAIGNKMALRFCDGSGLNLQLPEATFVVDLALQGLKKKVFQETPAGASVVFGSFLQLQISEPLTGKIYLNEQHKKGVSKIIPASQENVAEWPAFQESLLILLDETTQSWSKERNYQTLQKKVLNPCR